MDIYVNYVNISVPGIIFVVEKAGNVGDVALLAGYPQVAGASVKYNLKHITE